MNIVSFCSEQNILDSKDLAELKALIRNLEADHEY